MKILGVVDCGSDCMWRIVVLQKGNLSFSFKSFAASKRFPSRIVKLLLPFIFPSTLAIFTFSCLRIPTGLIYTQSSPCSPKISNNLSYLTRALNVPHVCCVHMGGETDWSHSFCLSSKPNVWSSWIIVVLATYSPTGTVNLCSISSVTLCLLGTSLINVWFDRPVNSGLLS